MFKECKIINCETYQKSVPSNYRSFSLRKSGKLVPHCELKRGVLGSNPSGITEANIFSKGKTLTEGITEATPNEYTPAEGMGSVSDIINSANNATPGLKYENIGKSTFDDAIAAGREFVGENPTEVLAKDGTLKELISESGLKRFRAPRFKEEQGKVQANFETRPNTNVKFGRPEKGTTNAHLDVVPLEKK